MSSEDHRIAFIVNHSRLVRKLTSLELLQATYTKHLITQEEKDRIEALKTDFDRLNKLLGIFHRRYHTDRDIFKKILEILEEINSAEGGCIDHVICSLKDVLKKPPTLPASHDLNQKDMACLCRHELTIIKTLNVCLILPDLISEGVVSPEESEAIESISDFEGRVQNFLSILKNRGSESFQRFLVILIDSGVYKNLAYILRESEDKCDLITRDKHDFLDAGTIRSCPNLHDIHVAEAKSDVQVSPATLGINDLREVFQFLKPSLAAPMWKELGLCLGLYKATLDKIECDYQKVDNCLFECLASWLKRTDGVDKIGSPSLTVLAKALIEIGDIVTADKICIEKDLKVDSLLLPDVDTPDYDSLFYETKAKARTSCLTLFGKYIDRFRDAISMNETNCTDFITTLHTEQVINIAEKNIADRMSHLTLKTNMMLKAVRSLLEHGSNPDMKLRKVVLIAKKYDCALFEDITQDMKINPEFCLEDKVKLFSESTSVKLHSDVMDQIQSGSSSLALEKSIKMFSDHLKYRYCCEKAPDSFDDFLPAPFIEPVMVRIDPYHGFGILNDNIENIKKSGSIVTMDDLGSISRGSRYLIEGLPGFGKTKLAFELRDRWVNGSALLEYSLFFFVQLRDLRIQSTSHLSTHNPEASKNFIAGLFMSSEEWNADALQNIIDTAGDGLFILFEGYNEVKNELPNDSILIGILIGRFLPKATVLVTSQPLNRSPIKKATNNLHNIKLVGFDETAINQFIAASPNEAKHQNLQYLPHAILSCLFIPIVLRLVTLLFIKDTHGLPLTLTKLYQSIVNKGIIKVSCPENCTRSVIESYKLNLGRIAWEGICNNEFSFEMELHFETLGLMKKEHCHSIIKDNIRYSFLHVTIQEYLAANFLATKFPDRVNEVFRKCGFHPKFSGILKFLAGLMPQSKNLYLPVPKKLHKFDILHQFFEAQCNHIVTSTGSVDVTHTFPTSHDMLALGYCIGRSHAQWNLAFTLRSLSKGHIEMLLSGIGAYPTGKIKELNLSLNELGCDGMIIFLKIPNCVFKPLTLLNLRGCGLSGEKTSEGVANFIALLPCLQKFSFHDNLFVMEKDEQLPVIQAICRSTTLTSITMSNLSPKECHVLLSHEFEEKLKKIALYQLHSDSIHSGLGSLVKSSINSLKICDSQLTPLHSKILPDKLRTPVSSIKILHLANCAIDDETLEHISDAILNGKVDRLNLNNNLITDKGSPSIIRMINSKRLKRLSLMGNFFREDTVCLFASLVVPKLKLHLSPKWKPFIDKKDVLFY